MKSVAVYVGLLLCDILVNYSFGDKPAVPKCMCNVSSQCDPITKWDDMSKEIIIMTNDSSEHEKWLWDSITTVVSMTIPLNTELMCYAHSKGAKYGIKRDIITDYNYTSDGVTEYINVIKQEIVLTRADVLMLDLMPLIGNCNNAKEHVEPVINVTRRVITEIKQPGNLRVVCVVPWKPPCYDSECMVGPALAKFCDAIEVNPDSFIQFCNDACIARATVPFSKMQMGLMEYEAVGFRPQQILLGMPWHGYNYTCKKLYTINSTIGRNVCTLERSPASNDSSSAGSCTFEKSRVRVPIEEFSIKHPAALVSSDTNYNTVDQAPYIVYRVNVTEGNKTVEKAYMGWFENIGSLHAKYEVVSQFGFKGIVVYTGDDLSYNSIQGRSLDDRMWAWVLHTILATGTVSFNKDEPDYAAIVAGVGVGMFVFGCLLGVIFACIYFRRSKILKPPFHSDASDILEYHDEDREL